MYIRYITQLLKNCIGPTIRIGPEILCLPYAGFFNQSVCIRTLPSLTKLSDFATNSYPYSLNKYI